jgi:hypothetical protein
LKGLLSDAAPSAQASGYQLPEEELFQASDWMSFGLRSLQQSSFHFFV